MRKSGSMMRLWAALLILICIGLAHESKANEYREIVVTTLGARTSSGNGTTFETYLSNGNYNSCHAVYFINVTAVSGTSPSLVPTAYSVVGSDLYPSAVGSAITAPGQYVLDVPCLADRTRFGYVITGTTPSFTFSATLIRY